MTHITWRDKSVRTPQGAILQVPHPRLAAAIQQEWDKAKKPNMQSMHYTTYAVSVIDIVLPKQDIIMKDIGQFIHGDVIYYFDDRDDSLIRHQHEAWDEWRLWAEARLGTEAKTTQGIIAIQQSDTYYNKAIEILRACDDWHFYALQNFISICGSFVLGYAFYCGEIVASRAISLSHADSLYQEQQWGEDSQTVEARQAIINELESLQNYLHLLDN